MNQPITCPDLLRQVKESAKQIARRGDSTHMEALEKLAREHGFSSYHELEKRASIKQRPSWFDDMAEGLECPPRSQIAYNIGIGESAWSLRVGIHGPLLHVNYRPISILQSEPDESEIGIYPVLNLSKNSISANSADDSKAPKNAWVVTRYGIYRKHTLEFMNEAEVKTLSHHFGIPFHHELEGLYQKNISEMRFYKSPAFAALRAALRTGKIPLPNLQKWSHGLCHLWAHLVALSDENFGRVNEIVDGYFKYEYWNLRGTYRAQARAIEKLWHQIPTLGIHGGGIDYGFLEVAESWKGSFRKRRLVEQHER